MVGRHNPNAFPLAAAPQTPAFSSDLWAVPGLGGCPLNFPRGYVIMVPRDKCLQLLSNPHTRIQLTLITVTGGADRATDQHPWKHTEQLLVLQRRKRIRIRMRTRQARAAAFFSPQSPGQETFASPGGRSIIYGRNWPAANDCSQVGAGKEVWRLITFNVITLDLQQGMRQRNLAFSLFSLPALAFNDSRT